MRMKMLDHLMLLLMAFMAILILPLAQGQGSNLLFLGPAYASFGQSEVFLTSGNTNLTRATCTVPKYPIKDIYRSVGFIYEDSLYICGGYSRSSSPRTQSDCFKLANSTWSPTSSLLSPRENAAAVRMHNGSVLISGGRDVSSSPLQSSELLTGSTWSPAMQLPSPRYDHCMLQLSTGALLINGGYSNSGPVSDTHISQDSRWQEISSSKKARYIHTCTEVTINSKQQVWVGGGYNNPSSEIFQLVEGTWTDGPDIPNYRYYSGQLVGYNGDLFYSGGYYNKNIYQLKDDWRTQQDAWTLIGKMTQGRYNNFPALMITPHICKGEKPTPLELSYNHDDSVGYVSGSLVPLLTQRASNSNESIIVSCCGGEFANTAEKTCGNGTSCNKICGERTSGCITVICEDCHTSSAYHQVCDAMTMEEDQWCGNSKTINVITSQCGTGRKKRYAKAPGITTPIYRINYCPRKCHSTNHLRSMPECCLHPAVRNRVKGAAKYCCTKFELCP